MTVRARSERMGFGRAARAMLAMAAGAGVCVGAEAPAGSLDGTDIADYRVWRSTRCYRPPEPSIQITDPLTYNLAVEAFNRYFEQMKEFVECVGEEANADFKTTQDVLERGLSRSRADALQDLERTRAAIERYRDAYSGPDLTGEAPPKR
ncbi:MAG: hypothetical protein RIM80_21355 [Alphaproteobacteria bacterium]